MAGPPAHPGVPGLRSLVRRGQPPARRPQGLRRREGPHQPPTRERSPMSEENRPPDLAQWGRPLRKRPRGPQVQPPDTGAPAVGPVGDTARSGGSVAVVHPGSTARSVARPRSSEPGDEEFRPGSAARPVARARSSEPGEEDLRLRGLVAYLARGRVDHPANVEVAIVALGDDVAFELHVRPAALWNV